MLKTGCVCYVVMSCLTWLYILGDSVISYRLCMLGDSVMSYRLCMLGDDVMSYRLCVRWSCFVWQFPTLHSQLAMSCLTE